MLLAGFSFRLAVFLLGGVAAQPDPWPPLVTTCDVMPLIAADANKHSNGSLACSSSAWPDCSTINCQIISNNDQLEMQLLPCWQHPAVWIKNRAIGGELLFQDIFDSSRVATANIGGQSVKLIITVVQRVVTLGFGVSIVVPGLGPQSLLPYRMQESVTIVPYRDIPLNLTECGGGNPGYPLRCKMLLYMQQSLITSYSAYKRDPAIVPQCQQPDTKSCDYMSCSWNNSGTVLYHNFKLLRCQKPQALNLVMSGSNGIFFLNVTYDHSTYEKLDGGATLNVTVTHPSDWTMGIQVTYITNNNIVTEIPYIVLPMDTTGCPPSLPPAFRVKPYPLSRHRTLYKQSRIETPQNAAPTKQETLPKAALPSVGALAPNHTQPLPPPLITTCDVMPGIAVALNSASNGILHSCRSFPAPNCTRIKCTLSSGEGVLVDFKPCSNPPSLHIIITHNSSVLSNVSITESGIINIDLFNLTVPLNFTLVQRTGFITMGIQVSSDNTTLLPYQEIPMNRPMCLGVIDPPPTCAAMLNIATILNVRLWSDCMVSTSSCNDLTCTLQDTTFSLLLSPCDHAVTIASVPCNASIEAAFSNTFRRTNQVVLDNTTQLNVLVNFNATRSTFGIQVGVLYREVSNHSNTLTVTYIPYIDIPVNLDICPSSSVNRPLIRTCDVFPLIASEVTDAVPDTLVCHSSRPPACNQVMCRVVSNNDTLTMTILPCHSPPAIQLTNVAINGTETFNETLTNTTLSLEAHIGDNPAIINITLMHHRQKLTLGIAINASIIESDQPVNVTFLPYYEVPLDRTPCSMNEPNQTSTCRVMNNVAQYVNIFVANMTHQPSPYCRALPDSLCHNITCPNPVGGGFNMSVLPCGEKIGFHLASANTSDVTMFSFTVFNSTTVHFTPHMAGEITLEQDHGGDEITFQMDLYYNGTYIGTEVPMVVIPVDKEMCEIKPPVKNDTIDFSPLITTCDVVPLIAMEVTGAISDTLVCHSSPPPACDQLACRVVSNNDTITMTILPCHSPAPAIQLRNVAINGTVTFNETLTNTTLSLEAHIGDDLAVLNITLVHHKHGRSMGIMINATITHYEQRVSVPFIPYYEIPLKLCSNATSLDTDTCRVMDNVGQYMSIFLANLGHQINEEPICLAVRGPTSLCNTLRCESSTISSTLSLLPCSDPIGVTGGYSNGDGTRGNFTFYNSGILNVSSDSYVDFTLDQLKPNVIGLALTLHLMQNSTTMVALTELPYVRIPVNASRCGENRPGNHSHLSLIGICPVLAEIARTATNLLPGVTCLSLNCETVSCMELASGEQWNFTIYSCWGSQFSPSVGVSIAGLNGTSKRLVASQAIPANPGGSEMIYVDIMQHSSNLSIGVEVSGTIVGGNKTFIPYKEIPLDRSSCPAREPVSDACLVQRNISQYINFVMSNVTGELTDCAPSDRCEGVMCRVGSLKSSLSLSIDRCHIPPALIVVVTNPNGTVVFNHSIVDSEILLWDILSAVLQLNVTVQHSNASTIGLHVMFEYPGNPGPLILVPMVTIPVDLTGCDTHPTYSIGPLVTPCQITPRIAMSAFPPAAIVSLRCTSSPSPNCSTITCSVPETNDSVSFKFVPCDNPPAITAENYVNGVSQFRRTFAHSLKFNFSTSKVPMVVSLTQHDTMMNVGFQVDFTTSDNTTIPFLPYREIPADHLTCHASTVSPTCKVMDYVAQYITVFMANFTTNAGNTPDCHADRRSLCNNIMCAEPATGKHYNFSFLACENPISFSISRGFPDGSLIHGTPYTGSQQIVLFGQYEGQLTLNSLGDGLVQLKIELTSDELSGAFIPIVNIPLDDQLCGHYPSTTSNTPTPTKGGDDTKLLIAVAVPVGSILAIIILVLLVVLAYYCCAKKGMSDEPYAYRPLSDHAEEGEGENEGVYSPLSGPPDEGGDGGAYSPLSGPPDEGGDGGAYSPLSGPPEKGEDDDEEEQPDV